MILFITQMLCYYEFTDTETLKDLFLRPNHLQVNTIKLTMSVVT